MRGVSDLEYESVKGGGTRGELRRCPGGCTPLTTLKLERAAATLNLRSLPNGWRRYLSGSADTRLVDSDHLGK